MRPRARSVRAGGPRCPPRQPAAPPVEAQSDPADPVADCDRRPDPDPDRPPLGDAVPHTLAHPEVPGGACAPDPHALADERAHRHHPAPLHAVPAHAGGHADADADAPSPGCDPNAVAPASGRDPDAHPDADADADAHPDADADADAHPDAHTDADAAPRRAGRTGRRIPGSRVSGAPTAPGRPRFEDPERPRQLAAAFPDVDRVFREFAQRVHAPGLAYGVVVDGELAHAGGVGTADVATGRPAGPDTIFRIASMTKSLTALCCLALRDQGRLGLDDPVTAHVPEAAGLRPPTVDSPVLTVRHLLTMSAGLVTDDPWGDRQLAMDSDAFSALLERGVPFQHPPATAYEYSNLGYALLGRLVSRAAGAPFPAVLAETVLRPLGMADSGLAAADVPEVRRALGYRWEEGAFVEEPPLGDGAFGPMGGLWTTIGDFARYVALHLDAWPPRDDPETGPVRRSTLREMHQGQRLLWPDPGWTGRLPCAYGFGLVETLHPRDGMAVAHSGGLPGFGSRVRWLPDHGVGVIGFANITYAPVHEAVDAAFDALAATGALRPRVQPRAPGSWPPATGLQPCTAGGTIGRPAGSPRAISSPTARWSAAAPRWPPCGTRWGSWLRSTRWSRSGGCGASGGCAAPGGPPG